MEQLALSLKLRTEATFATFSPGANAPAVASIQALLEDQAHGTGRQIHLWGEGLTGKTHLLQAACHAFAGRGACVYLPLALLQDTGPGVLDGMAQAELICLDDVDAVAGKEWEHALFGLLEAARQATRRFLIASRRPPGALKVMPALASRLQGGVVFRLHALSDEDRYQALLLHAHQRGLVLSEPAGWYLLRHCPRDFGSLIGILERLDEASLAHARRVSVALIKRMLDISQD